MRHPAMKIYQDLGNSRIVSVRPNAPVEAMETMLVRLSS